MDGNAFYRVLSQSHSQFHLFFGRRHQTATLKMSLLLQRSSDGLQFFALLRRSQDFSRFMSLGCGDYDMPSAVSEVINHQHCGNGRVQVPAAFTGISFPYSSFHVPGSAWQSGAENPMLDVYIFQNSNGNLGV
jgi:hypothetical protein